MTPRKRIAILYSVSYNNNTGVVIYLQNIIKHFLAFEDQLKPHLIILYSASSPLDEIRQLQYPYVEYTDMDKLPSLLIRGLNKIIRMISGHNWFLPFIKADFAFPAYPLESLRKVKHMVYWKEDFQENYYPQFFDAASMAYVRQFFQSLQQDPKQKLVLSSYEAQKDLGRFYPLVKNPVHIFRFVSLLPALNPELLPTVLDKFRTGNKYFIVCNQFWPHKNHMLVLEAVHILHASGVKDFKVVLTGKTTSTRDKEYFPSLQKYIQEHKLEPYIVITGFLSREDQLLLMKHSLAVVQPSLFEGWSTVIEDAKALNKYVLAADLPVNMEQTDRNISFFERHSAGQLADLMQMMLEGKNNVEPLDYSIQIEGCRKSLIELFDLTTHPQLQ